MINSKPSTLTKIFGLLLLFSLLLSCIPTAEQTVQKDNPIVITTKDSVLKKIPVEQVKIINLDSILENFLTDVRKIPFTKITDSSLLAKKVSYLEFFPKKGISKIILYTSEKAKQKRSLRYTDLYLVSLEYESDILALQAFQAIKTEVELLIAPAARGNFDDKKKYKTSRYIDPYHGGFLIKKGNRVFSLGKKCGGNRLKLNFRDYEKLFLQRLGHQEEDSEIIKANCGDIQFKILTTYK